MITLKRISDGLQRIGLFFVLLLALVIAPFMSDTVDAGEIAACRTLPAAAKIDPTSDLVVAHYDIKPDVDDLHASAAFATILHSMPDCLTYRVVTGTYGTQDGEYIDAPEYLSLAFGDRWLDAHNDRDNAVATMVTDITNVLTAGGDVWIAEGGQSDFTADVLAVILENRSMTNAVKSRVHIVQHSDWNEQTATPEKLAFAKANADYVRIADGNTSKNGTPDFASNDTAWWPRLLSDPRVGSIWAASKRLADAANPAAVYINPAVKAGGLDFSDTVEWAHILGFQKMADHRAFFEWFLTPAHDTVAPHITRWMDEPAMLVFSKTESWRHNKGIAGADLFFTELAAEKGMAIYTTENGATFTPEILARFDLIIFNNVSGDVLNTDQEAAFMSWMHNDGAWIGLHSAGDASSQGWPAYHRKLIGSPWMGHPADPQLQEARVVNLAPHHPIMADIPSEWMHTDEWYSFTVPASEYGMIPILGLDEKTYAPVNRIYGDVEDLRMGDEPADHPIIWTKCEGNFRSVYSALGHDHTSYNNPSYRALLSNAADWVLERDSAAGCSTNDEN